MEYKEHELQTLAPEAFLSALYWSRMIELTGVQSRLNRRRCNALMKAYCCTVPYFETEPEHARRMILYLNSRLTVPVREKELDTLIESGRRFYDRNKTDADTLLDVVAEAIGYDPMILMMHTLSVLANLKAHEKDRNEAEKVLERLDFAPLYKE